MAECKWYQDEFCVNGECPMRADYCPVPDIPEVCRHEDRTPKERVAGNMGRYDPYTDTFIKERGGEK